MKRKIAVIGSGFSGLSAASYAAKSGHEVHIFEKNETFGGRARQFETVNGFVFDMGPSWYWMPDIFDDYFADFGKKTSDFYELISLNPQFEMVFSDSNLNLPENFDEMKTLFESIEPGAAQNLEKFMADAKYKYEVGMKDFVTKPCFSWTEFFSLKILKSAVKLDLLSNFRSFVGKYFKNHKLRTLMEFPVIFLGASPENIPALYSLMNYGGYKLGTYYPMGGFYKIIDGMMRICEDLGVTFHNNSPVEKIINENGKVQSLLVNGKMLEFDSVIASCDYHHTETKLLSEDEKNYKSEYWKSKTFAPSCLIFYLGISERVKIKHHTLFFENDLDLHTSEIYTDKKWPSKPLFYVCSPSQTDPSVAPEGCENLFLLMPIATGIEDSEDMREKYFAQMIKRIEKHTGFEDLTQKIIYNKSFCINDFKENYNAYEGNAYGLANTLNQTAVLKPSLKNKKIKNLFYTGQLTVPGPGVPPSIISGKIAAHQATL
ncbi:phytoene dehydrogenase [Chryseobacterium sp. Leaf404]|uniref:phytoene desaturase family protein n=1 Tax=unclassified Chryseobacterium TaxID=2593645 RepID=UPI0006FE3DE9|nr:MULTISPECIES: phytoene desaturase family protein [unclassified Chryseobacterium]KQT17931.1 phytoene dehydrogenase [Chryseobacterium sp. Leaf404]